MSKNTKYKGVIVPMVTPFTADGDIDKPSTEKIVEHLVEAGTSAFVLGTIGEGASIPLSLRTKVVEGAVKKTDNRTTTYAGLLCNCVSDAIEAAKNYFDLGIDVVIVPLASYYPLNESQMLNYFETVAESIPGPMMVYNITITTGMSVPLEVIEKLSHHERIVGLKDSENNIERMEKAVSLWRDRTDFSYSCGHGSLAAKSLLLGGDGIVPGTANLVPKLFQDFYQAAIGGDIDKVNALQKKITTISRIYQEGKVFSETVAALKVMMSTLGLCGEKVLPPLTELTSEEKKEITDRMGKLQIFD
jgi:dihydrodipicolinate synthase/N-acetylneuraminate lyase